jgi:hypothetical protein
VIGQHRMLMGDYHIGFTLPAPNPDHCPDCAERATLRNRIRQHVTIATTGYSQVDLTTPDLRYIATVARTPTGDLANYDRLAGETIEHWTDPDAPKGPRYSRI